jgi:hypothetical protein
MPFVAEAVHDLVREQYLLLDLDAEALAGAFV